MPEEIDHQKLIREKIAETEARAVRDLGLIREMVADSLVHAKGYSDGDIETDTVFEIVIEHTKTPVSVDYILTLNNRRLMVIKCSPGALESRDRHLIAFARVGDAYQIPFAAVTDGLRARILDTKSGKLIAEGLDAIPGRAEALEMLASMEFVPCPAERLEREKRILLAFDAIKCTEESGE
jgi:hypothetical protein